MQQSIFTLLNGFLSSRLNAKAAVFVNNAQNEIHSLVPDARFTALISLASRYIPRQLLAPSLTESACAQTLLPGWSLQSWSLLETVRVSLILSRSDLLQSDFAERYNQWFAYADEGELCAYYRAIAALPDPQRFAWRAAEGCRTNMKTVFLAVACDSPYPQQYFDDVAWNQLVVKALFIETPLARICGLDQRLSTTLALTVLDYMDECNSAGRAIPVDAWLCLGSCADIRFDCAIDRALKSATHSQRIAAVVALGRAQRVETLQKLLDNITDSRLTAIVRQVLNGRVTQTDFQEFVSQ